MSDFQENEKNIQPENEVVAEAEVKEEYHDELDQFSSVFSDPEAHNDKPKSNGKKRLVAIIAALLAVAILVGGTIAVIKLIPVLEDDESQGSVFEDIKVVDVDSDKLSTVTVKNSKGEFKFYSVTSEDTEESSDTSSDNEKAVSWLLEGVDMDKTSTSEINSIISSAASVTASREIDTKTAAECGLDKPSIKVDVTSDQVDGYSILVGSASPDGTGTYLKLSTDDKIYIVDDSAFSSFEFEALDLANTSAFAAASFTNTTGYASDDGTLNTFDELTIGGKDFGETVKIVPTKEDNELSSIVAYNVVEPTKRIADDTNVAAAFGLFTGNLSVAGAYSYDIDDASLAAVGLDNPDLVVSLTVGGETKTYKISYVDSEYCAVINDDSVMIRKVAVSNISFAGAKTESFYSNWVMMQMINDIDTISFTTEGTEYSFDITYDDTEGAEKPYTVMYGDKELDDANFRDFYQVFVGLTANSFEIKEVSGDADTKVEIKLTNKTVRTLELYKVSDTAYQYHEDGKPMGTITSSAYNKLIKNLKLAAEDKKVTQ